MARRITRAEQKAIERQRRGLSSKTVGACNILTGAGEIEEPERTARKPYDTTNRPRVTNKASGARGWYASTEWKRRSREHQAAYPDCVGCGGRATVADHIEWAHPDDRLAVLEGALQSMCWADHQQKSCDDRAKRAGRKPRPIKRRVEIDPATGMPKPGQERWHWWSEPE
jgi:hypothetical protein